MSLQRIEKYACLELERRFLLTELPVSLAGQPYRWHIIDRYLPNTRLRLRRMSAYGDEQDVTKFGQKYRKKDQSAAEAILTNLYLNEAEYSRLSSLEARELIKKRYSYPHQGFNYSIDVFEGRLAGLILAEIECETTEQLTTMRVPAFALREVTADLFFTGGNLASLTRTEFEIELAERLKGL
jgi:CYTH domain-containing protein